MLSRKSIDDELDKLLYLIRKKINESGIKIGNIKNIDYGYQLEFKEDDNNAKINVYYSQKKKRYSFLTQPSNSKQLLNKVVRIFESVLYSEKLSTAESSIHKNMNESGYSHIKEIDNLIQKSINGLNFNGFTIENHKDINYGTNFDILTSSKNFLLTIFWSKDKGFKLLFPNEVDENIKDKIKQIIFSNVEKESSINIQFNVYYGMDESGKGDYFGPLVIAGFRYDDAIEKDLLSIGVCDSKLLNNEQIKYISHKILFKYPDRVKIHQFNPKEYNRYYDTLKRKGGNLNTLLTTCYSELIKSINDFNADTGIIIDKFASEPFILKILEKVFDKHKIILIENAERNLAVAAASIIARSVFVKNIEEMSAKYNFDFPFGAGENVLQAAKNFLELHGEENLFLTCKKHFKTTNYIVNSLF